MGGANDQRERIIDTAESLLRRHGLAKTTVVDVARALGMSHANVYRHFSSKTALRDAVAERWLKSLSDSLEAFVRKKEPAQKRLEGWVLALAAAKRRKVLDDPELFATYHALAEAAREVVDDHVETLRTQVERIIADGAAEGAFKVANPKAAAAAVLNAMLRFHHPYHVRERAGANDRREIRAVLRLISAGLGAGVI